MKVLIADDSLDAAKMLATVVKMLGHEAAFCMNGAEALLKAKEWLPDCIILDLSMPQLNGIEVCRLLKCGDGTSQAFVAAVTGYSDAQHRQKCWDAGFDGFYGKPMGQDEVQELLAWALQHKEQKVT
jgi:CheY-like chemotaxis protein